MAEEISNGEFKSEMLEFKTEMRRFVEVANQKFDGVITDVRSTHFRIDKLESKFDSLENKFDSVDQKIDKLTDVVRTISNQMGSVVTKVIENEHRLGSVESRVEILEAESH